MCDRHPLHPFVLIKALNVSFLMFPLQKKENNSLLGMTIFTITFRTFFRVNTEYKGRQKLVYTNQVVFETQMGECFKEKKAVGVNLLA